MTLPSLACRAAAIAFLACVPLFMDATSASAQNARVEFLETQIERLNRELQDLQRQVYRGEPGTASPGAQPAPQGGTALSSSAAARIDERLSSMEGEIRSLRDELEKTRHAVRLVTDRVDKLVADVDFRLNALEQGGAGTQANAPGNQARAQGSDLARNRPDGRPERSPAVSRALEQEGQRRTQLAPGEAELPEGVRSLGTVPMRALEEGSAARQSGDASGSQGTAASGSDSPSQGRQQASMVTQQDAAAMSPEGAYNKAYTLLKTAKFDQAEQALDSFIKTYPDHALAENARYWLGETYYVRGDFERAALTFADGYRSYPSGAKAPDNLLKLARSLAELGDNDNACATLQTLSQKFPGARPAIEQSASATRSRLGCS